VHTLILERLEVGNLSTNCYILGCEETKKCAVIDPGDEGERILDLISEKELQLEKVINTHGHYDHVGADSFLKQKTGASVYIHRADKALLENDPINKMFGLLDHTPVKADVLLEDGDDIIIGSLTLKVIHTPGHTPGCICLLVDHYLFSGDTLFAGSIGRTDLPGGNYQEIILSLKNKLAVLEDDLQVFPGHGPQSNLGFEKRTNPYF